MTWWKRSHPVLGRNSRLRPNLSTDEQWSILSSIMDKNLVIEQRSSLRHANLMWMKKAPRETQTLCAGCSKAEPKIFAPPQTPFAGARDDQNLISWRWSPPLPTNPVWWGSMHAISSYRGNRPTYPHPLPTHRQDGLQYTAPQLSHSVTIQSNLQLCGTWLWGVSCSAV